MFFKKKHAQECAVASIPITVPSCHDPQQLTEFLQVFSLRNLLIGTSKIKIMSN